MASGLLYCLELAVATRHGGIRKDLLCWLYECCGQESLPVRADAARTPSFPQPLVALLLVGFIAVLSQHLQS